jgi:hypothetical protein
MSEKNDTGGGARSSARTGAIRGSCLCGGVRYEARGPVTKMTSCHCVQCRKASGAEFATNGSVLAEHFRVVEGDALLARYESSPRRFRFFCGRCGSPLFKRDETKPEWVRLRLGCVDTDLEERPRAHIFVREAPNWSRIPGDLPQFDGMP